MAGNTERITILGTSELKMRLTDEAREQNISVGELVRRKFEPNGNNAEEVVLHQLIKEVKSSTKMANKALDKSYKEVNKILSEIRKLNQ